VTPAWRLGAVATAVLALSLAACTTGTVRQTGVVTGVADPCEGAFFPTGEVLHVKVSLCSGSKAKASEKVRSGARYRFSVAPGAYQVTGWWGSKGVTVRAGQSVTANFRDVGL